MAALLPMGGRAPALAACIAALLASCVAPARANVLNAHRKPAATVLTQKPSGLKKAVADSKVIEGSDCGNSKQVLKHWARAKKVGHVAGSARGAVMHADHVNDLVSEAADRAREIGINATVASGMGNEPPPAVAHAVEAAEAAASNLTDASGDLDTELTAFNNKRKGNTEWPKGGVDDMEILKIKEMTEQTNFFAKLAEDAAVNALARAKKAEAGVKSELAANASMVKAFVDKARASIQDSNPIFQQALWLYSDSQDKVTKAQGVAAKLGDDEKVTEEALGNGTQRPVLDALAEILTNTSEGVTQAGEDLNSAVSNAESVRGELLGFLVPMKQESDNAAAGDMDGLPAEAGKVMEAEGVLFNFEMAVHNVTAKMDTLRGRVDKLAAKQAEAELMLK